ncbi:mannose receptor, C type [Sarotherodon galilaeus]
MDRYQSVFEMPLGPGADAALACFTTFSTSLHVGGLMSIWYSGAWIELTRGKEMVAIVMSELASPYREMFERCRRRNKNRMEETCLLLILLLSGGLSTLPPHSREYQFVNQLMNWTEAQSYCREHFTDLVTIYNSNINQLLLSMSPNIDTYAWLGLYDDRYSWKWSMEGKLFYVGSTHEFLIWANGQPDCVNANEYCVALQGQTQMNDRPCGDSYPFLCYNAKNTSYILVKESRSWSEAQSYCRTYHTDLTSIRSKEEKSNITLTLNGSGVQYVWIGLYRDPWAFWSDNTTSTFTNWMPSQPNNYNSAQYCVTMYFMSGKWSDSACNEKAYVFCFTGEVQNANTVRSCHHVKH